MLGWLTLLGAARRIGRPLSAADGPLAGSGGPMGVGDDAVGMGDDDTFIKLPDSVKDEIPADTRKAIESAVRSGLHDRYEDQNEVRTRVYRVRCESGVRIRIPYRSDEWLTAKGPQAA